MTNTLSYGPRLVATPTGALRAAVLVAPSPAIENARPLPGEPNAIYTRALAAQGILAKTLRFFGCEVTTLGISSNDPHSCAAVDAAILFENGAVMMRPSSMTRRPESAWLEEAFVKHDIPIAGHIAAPGLLDGSDVLLAGKTAFIGVSRRSNALGRTGFAEIAKAHGFTVREVVIAQSAVSLRACAGIVSADTVVLAPEHRLDHSAFDGFKKFVTPLNEEAGAGVLNLGDGHVLASVRFPTTNNMLRRGGATVEAIDLYDFDRIGLTPSMLAIDVKRT